MEIGDITPIETAFTTDHVFFSIIVNYLDVLSAGRLLLVSKTVYDLAAKYGCFQLTAVQRRIVNHTVNFIQALTLTPLKQYYTIECAWGTSSLLAYAIGERLLALENPARKLCYRIACPTSYESAVLEYRRLEKKLCTHDKFNTPLLVNSGSLMASTGLDNYIIEVLDPEARCVKLVCFLNEIHDVYDPVAPAVKLDVEFIFGRHDVALNDIFNDPTHADWTFTIVARGSLYDSETQLGHFRKTHQEQNNLTWVPRDEFLKTKCATTAIIVLAGGASCNDKFCDSLLSYVSSTAGRPLKIFISSNDLHDALGLYLGHVMKGHSANVETATKVTLGKHCAGWRFMRAVKHPGRFSFVYKPAPSLRILRASDESIPLIPPWTIYRNYSVRLTRKGGRHSAWIRLVRDGSAFQLECFHRHGTLEQTMKSSTPPTLLVHRFEYLFFIFTGNKWDNLDEFEPIHKLYMLPEFDSKPETTPRHTQNRDESPKRTSKS